MTVLAFPYTARGARNERAGYERYLALKARVRMDRRPGGIGNALVIVAAFWAIVALIVWGIWL
jgi:hypothetical protein